MATRNAFIEVFKLPKKKLYRWRKIGRNGRKIAQSCESFKAARYAGYAAKQEYGKTTRVKYVPPAVA